MLPGLSRLRLVRHWGGVMDMTMDGSPIIAKTPLDGLYLNGGWCYGGFKATPGSGWVFAHTIANDAPHAAQRGLQPGALRDRCAARREGRRPDARLALSSAAMLIPCPFCGPREHAEFAYGGDATVRRPRQAEPVMGTGMAGLRLSSAPIRAGRIASTGSTPPAAGNGSSSRATR